MIGIYVVVDIEIVRTTSNTRHSASLHDGRRKVPIIDA